jgi:two-component system osmolarity sensor histidine kinase EnvZ
MFLKRFAPRSLYRRFLLIVIIPIIVIQALAVYMFYERHWKSVSRNIAASLAGEISFLLATMETSPELARAQKLNDIKKHLNLNASFINNSQPIANFGTQTNDFNELNEELTKVIHAPVHIVDRPDDSEILLIFTTQDGQLLVHVPRKRLANPTTYIYIMWILGGAIVLLVVAILFLKNQVRSIIRLSEAAEKFGKGQEITDFKPHGATEVRQAAQAFIGMKNRINRQIKQRTEMLAGVSHDLRTPLTRMKLQLAMFSEGDAKKSLEEDVADMEHMLEGYLTFVRSGEVEKSKPINMRTYLDKIIHGYRNHDETIEADLKADAELHIKKHAMKRAITNLIDNAIQYGKHVTISTRIEKDHFLITLDDDGPGIEEEKRESVFSPFVRLDSSRNKETGGIGLGLTIAKDTIHSHGGNITLDESPAGGLRVIISLPV